MRPQSLRVSVLQKPNHVLHGPGRRVSAAQSPDVRHLWRGAGGWKGMSRGGTMSQRRSAPSWYCLLGAPTPDWPGRSPWCSEGHGMAKRLCGRWILSGRSGRSKDTERRQLLCAMLSRRGSLGELLSSTNRSPGAAEVLQSLCLWPRVCYSQLLVAGAGKLSGNTMGLCGLCSQVIPGPFWSPGDGSCGRTEVVYFWTLQSG